MTRVRLNAEQERAAATLEGPVLVAAGAGSGKTRALAHRCANAVMPGSVPGWQPVALDQLLAITFTEKAAGELAERVRSTLKAEGAVSLARQVDKAWISTIHAMCARILRAESLEAGIDPSFAVLDGVTTGELSERAFEEIASEALETAAPGALLFDFYPFGQVAEVVRAAARSFATGGIRPEALAMPRGPEPARILAEAIAFYRDAAMRLQACPSPEDIADAHRQACDRTADELERLLHDAPSDAVLVRRLYEVLSVHRQPGTSKGLADVKAEVKETTKVLLGKCVDAVSAPLATGLAELIGAYADRFAELKRKAGGLDFDDLQIAVRDLFQRRPELAEAWSSRFRLAMVDEFQDTDALQLEIVERLAGGNLCTVGDELQSIYRFRGAEVEVYRSHNRQMCQRGAESIPFRLNYRSHPQILGFVNEVFRQPFQGRLVELLPGREEPEPPVVRERERVRLILSPKIGNSSVPSWRALAARIAEEIARLNEADNIPFSDVVILLRNYTHAGLYADALRARGVEAIVLGGNRFFGMPEVGVLMALCRTLANRRDEEAFACVLASPLCGLSDDGLLGLRRAVERGEAESMRAATRTGALAGDDIERVAHLERVLGEAAAHLGTRPLGQTLLRVFEGTGWDLRCLARGSDGVQAYATVLKFARLADEFEDVHGSGPAGFVAHLEAKQRFHEPESPAAVTGEGTQAVRIMSIHASKGLEFPVVVVPELDAAGASHSQIANWSLRPEPRLGIKLPGDWGDARESTWFSEISEEQKAANEEEALRLYYVAFTRARELLVLASGLPKKLPESIVGLVISAVTRGKGEPTAKTYELEGCGPVAVEIVEAAESDQPLSPDGPASVGSPSADVREWLGLLEDALPIRPASRPPQRLSYSRLKVYESCPKRFHAQVILGLVGDGSIADSNRASDLGSAVHTALELGLSARDDSRLDALSRYHRLDHETAGRLLTAIARFSASRVAREVEAFGGNVRREAPFAVRVGHADDVSFLLDGSIDLYARDGDRALVVDYKTGKGAETGELLERYKLQARCYAFAVLRDGASSVDVAFVLPEVAGPDGDPQTVRFSFSGADVSGIEDELLGLYGGMLKGEYGPADVVGTGRSMCLGCPVAHTCENRSAHPEGSSAA